MGLYSGDVAGYLPGVHVRLARCRYKGLVMVLPSLCNGAIQPLLHHNPALLAVSVGDPRLPGEQELAVP